MAYNDCLNILRNGYKKVGKKFDEKTATQFLEEYKAEQRKLQLQGYKMEDAVRPGQMPKFITSYVNQQGEIIKFEPPKMNYEDLFFYKYQQELSLVQRAKDIQKMTSLKKALDLEKNFEQNMNDFRRVFKDKQTEHEVLYKKQGSFTGLFGINKKYELIDMEADVAVGQVMDTNFTRNSIPLDIKIHRNKTNIDATFVKKTRAVLDDQEWSEWLENVENKRNFIKEYARLKKSYDQGEDISKVGATESGDVQAKNLAVEVLNIYRDTLKRFEETGIDTRNFKPFNIKIVWSEGQLIKTGRNAFIEDVAPRISNVIGKNLDERKQLAGEIFDHIVRDKGSWHDVDGLLQNYKSRTTEGLEYDTYHLEWNSGDDFIHILDTYNPTNRVSHAILRMIESNAEQLALRQHFGADVDLGISKLIDSWKERFGKGYEKVSTYHRNILSDAESYINEIRNPAIRDVIGIPARAISTARTVLAGANLGGAVITSFLDTMTQLFGGHKIFKMTGLDALRTVFRIKPQTLDAQSQKQLAKYFSTFGEGYINSPADRYALLDSFRDQRGAQRFTSEWTHRVLKYSGLNRLTESGQQASGLVYHRYLSELVKDVQWKDLDPELQNNLIKYGLNETDWKYIKDENIFTQDGDVDLYNEKLQSTQGAYKLDSTIQDKWTAAVKDAVDTMVIKPSEFDKRATSLFQNKDQGWATQLIRSMTQFKTHPITYTRKIYMRKFFRKQAELSGKQYTHAEKLVDIAYLTASNFLMAYLVNVTKDVAKGKQPQNIVTAEDRYAVMERALITGGALGLVSDTFFNLASPLLEQLMSPEEKVRYTRPEVNRLFLGPLVQDIYNLIQDTSSMGTGGIQYAYGLEDAEYFTRNISKLGKYALHLTGAETFVGTALIYRLLVNEYITQMIDYDGYRRKQKNLQREADKTRGGEVNNFIYKNLGNALGIN